MSAQLSVRWGRPIATLPPTWGRVTALLVLFCVAGLAFLFLASFARKEMVRGRVVNSTSEARVYASSPGTIAKLHVQLGDIVKKGAPLVDVDTFQVLGGGEVVTAEEENLLRRQLQALSQRHEHARVSARLEIGRIDLEIDGLKRDRTEFLESKRLVELRLELARQRLDAAERMNAAGAASQEEVRARQDQLLGQEQQLIDSVAQISHAEAKIGELGVVKAQREQQLDDELVQLDVTEAQLSAQIVRAQAGSGFVVSAPVDGKVAALQAGLGERVDPLQPMLTLLPIDSSLIAEVLVPSRAIAFVKLGQEVRLEFDAFPYQKFGTGSGRIETISETTLSPQELRATVRAEEPVYRVRVSMNSTSMRAFGQAVPLQSGMELSASILLEDRTLIEWILEPLIAASARAVGT